MTGDTPSDRKITKAFILGAGLGTRLRPLTNILPKPLVPFYHEPLIVTTLRRCQAAGITDIMINTHHLPETWKQFFPSGHWENLSLHFSHEPRLLDTGGGIKNVSEWINGQHILVCNADILTDIPLQPLLEAHRKTQALATLSLRTGGHLCNVFYNTKTYAIEDMRFARSIHPGTHQFTGIYCLAPEVLLDIPPNIPSSIVTAFLKLMPQGLIHGHLAPESQSYWLDLGTPESYLEAHQLLSGQHIHPMASIDPSAYLDNRCIIGENAHIGPHCHLENCIVWQGVHLPNHTHAINRIFTGQE